MLPGRKNYLCSNQEPLEPIEEKKGSEIITFGYVLKNYWSLKKYIKTFQKTIFQIWKNQHIYIFVIQGEIYRHFTLQAQRHQTTAFDCSILKKKSCCYSPNFLYRSMKTKWHPDLTNFTFTCESSFMCHFLSRHTNSNSEIYLRMPYEFGALSPDSALELPNHTNLSLRL